MDNPNVFRSVASMLEGGQSVALVTVIATTGSTPGKVGYKMLVSGDGATVGTVGGGLVEAKMIDEARHMLDRPASRLFRFDLGETPDDEKGICGGSVEFLVETFDGTALPLFRELATAAGGADAGVLVSVVAPDGLPRKFRLEHGERADAAGTGLSQEVAAAIREAATSNQAATKVSAGAMDVFIETLAVQPTLVLFGAGHLSYDIARLAGLVHFRVVVCDDRPEYANPARFPDVDEIVIEDFTRALDRIPIDSRSYLVIVTRGHKHDQIVLEQAVRTGARYIGMIGSKRKTLTLLEKLRKKGIPDELLNRVYSPVGLSIGAVTPQEIALSIVCELVKIRRLGDGAQVEHMTLSRGEGPS